MVNAKKLRTAKVPIFKLKNIENDRKKTKNKTKKIVMTFTFQSAHLI